MADNDDIDPKFAEYATAAGKVAPSFSTEFKERVGHEIDLETLREIRAAEGAMALIMYQRGPRPFIPRGLIGDYAGPLAALYRDVLPKVEGHDAGWEFAKKFEAAVEKVLEQYYPEFENLDEENIFKVKNIRPFLPAYNAQFDDVTATSQGYTYDDFRNVQQMESDFIVDVANERNTPQQEKKLAAGYHKIHIDGKKAAKVLVDRLKTSVQNILGNDLALN